MKYTGQQINKILFMVFIGLGSIEQNENPNLNYFSGGKSKKVFIVEFSLSSLFNHAEAPKVLSI